MDEQRVLLAEDDKNLGAILQSYLIAKGYPTDLCINGEEAFNKFKKGKYSVCILDVMMPLKDGFTLAEDIRKTDKIIPILFLTAKTLHEDKIKGFEIGADDYISKPFSMEELLVRLKAILRRVRGDGKSSNKSHIYKLNKYTFDYNRQLLSKDGNDQRLTSKETELLRLLCENMNEVLDRSVALNKIWYDDSYFNARSMDVYITKLRKYLKNDPKVELMNVHGIGFKLIVNK